MKKLLYITNIPAPYRQKRYNLMKEIFPKNGIEFEVLYMAKIEPDRDWIIPKESFKYDYKIYKGIHPSIGGFFCHFNPGLLIRLLRKDYDIAIVGGMASPSHWLAPFFIPKKVLKVMSVESNLYSTVRKTGIGAKIKEILIDKMDAYQVTGTPQMDYINYFSKKASKKPFIKLPNIIDEEIFRDRVASLRGKENEIRSSIGLDANTQMWILPSRLIPIKGIIPFISLLKNVQGIKLFIIGNGPLDKQVRELVEKENLPVTILGFKQQDELIYYYAAADLFVLPSLKDASPLSAIEACAAGLPLLVSSRIGNLEDVLDSPNNGWHYDPENEKEKGKEIVQKISHMSRNELKEKGYQSLKRFNDIFEGRKCVESYVKQLNTVLNLIKG
ncbi:MAG TPA: glycosyltransferase family 4 protein [Bacteroidales bacterium]|nr:glycosyltransferase family 4 protein [Bacteroidales bacterium]